MTHLNSPDIFCMASACTAHSIAQACLLTPDNAQISAEHLTTRIRLAKHISIAAMSTFLGKVVHLGSANACNPGHSSGRDHGSIRCCCRLQRRLRPKPPRRSRSPALRRSGPSRQAPSAWGAPRKLEVFPPSCHRMLCHTPCFTVSDCPHYLSIWLLGRMAVMAKTPVQTESQPQAQAAGEDL